MISRESYMESKTLRIDFWLIYITLEKDHRPIDGCMQDLVAYK